VSRARVSSGGLKSNASGLLSALLARSRVRLERCLLWARWYWLRLLSKHPPQLSTPLYCVCLTCQRLSNVAPCLAASGRVRRGHACRVDPPVAICPIAEVSHLVVLPYSISLMHICKNALAVL
jgi:hypothetical protein